MGNYLDNYTFEYLMERALARVPDNVDKRQGSIIYDALAPAIYELASAYLDLKLVLQRTYAPTADGVYLDYRVGERGITREPATYAICKAEFKDSTGAYMNIPLGSLFKTVTTEGGILFTVKEQYIDNTEGGTGQPVTGIFLLESSVLGLAGNGYVGELLSVSYIDNLAEATMLETVTPGVEEEADDVLYARFEMRVNEPPFGGNFSDYKEKVTDIKGIGQVQVYPTWDGGGTVKVSCLDSNNVPLTPEKITEVGNILDPVNYAGYYGDGLGVAPIGHTVTVSTPVNKEVDVDITLVLLPGFSITNVQNEVTLVVQNYFNQLLLNWGKEQNEYKTYSTIIYRANILAYTLQVPGVATVTTVLLNGVAEDITLEENATTQEIPKVGVVNVHT